VSPSLSDHFFSHTESFGYGAFWEGLMWPLVSVQLGMANCQSPHFEHGGARAMVCFASSPPTPHPLSQSTPTGLSHSFTHIKSSPCIKSGLFVCTMVCFVPSPPPSHHSPIHFQQVSAIPSLASSPHLASILGVVGLSPSSPDTLFANPPSQSPHSALACQL